MNPGHLISSNDIVSRSCLVNNHPEIHTQVCGHYHSHLTFSFLYREAELISYVNVFLNQRKMGSNPDFTQLYLV